jgi:hypothetical protein
MATAALVGVKVGCSVLVGVGVGSGASAPHALSAASTRSVASVIHRLRRRAAGCRLLCFSKLTILVQSTGRDYSTERSEVEIAAPFAPQGQKTAHLPYLWYNLRSHPITQSPNDPMA